MASFALAALAALCFTIGGVFMKQADGMTRPVPTLAMFFFLKTRCAIVIE